MGLDELEAVAAVGLNRNAASFDPQVETLLQAKPEAVVFISNGPPIVKIVQAMRARGYQGKFDTSQVHEVPFLPDRVTERLQEEGLRVKVISSGTGNVTESEAVEEAEPIYALSLKRLLLAGTFNFSLALLAGVLGVTQSPIGEALGIDPARVAVERNREIVPRSTLSVTPVADGDSFEIVHFVGGG